MNILPTEKRVAVVSALVEGCSIRSTCRLSGVGSIWTWTALCAETKLMVSWRLGARDSANAHAFISDVADRLANRVQLTTDGNRVYLDAVEEYLGGEVDYAQLIKQYGESEAA